MVQTFHADTAVQQNFVIDGIVCLADARALSRALAENQPPANAEETAEEEGVLSLIQEQLALADRVLLSKVDVLLSSPSSSSPPCEDTGAVGREEGRRLEALGRVEAFIRGINPSAPIVHCVKGQVEVEDVLNLRTLSLKRALALDPHFVDLHEDNEGEEHHHHDHQHEKEGGHSHEKHGKEEKGHAGGVKVHTHVALRFTSVPVLVRPSPSYLTIHRESLTLR